jgi:hypothetical protein
MMIPMKGFMGLVEEAMGSWWIFGSDYHVKFRGAGSWLNVVKPFGQHQRVNL